MPTNTHRTMMPKLPLALLIGLTAVLGLCVPRPLPAATPVHQVAGSGVVDLRNDTGPGLPLNVVFQVNVSARQDDAGRVSGAVESNIFALFDNPDVPISFKAAVTCLLVDGDAAWIGADVTESNDTTFAPIGSSFIVFVRDLGGPQEDRMHAEFAADIGNPVCTDRPDIGEDLIDLGNYELQ